MVKFPEGESSHQQIFEHYLGVPVAEEDQWHEDPGKRAAFVLHNSAVALNSLITGAGGARQDAGSIVRNFSTTLRKGGEAVEVGYLLRVPSAVAPEYRERMEVLATKAGSILHDKGFRFENSLLTPREHKEVGSSGYGTYYDVDPDVPVPVLHGRLLESGQMQPEEGPYGHETHSVEESDRARRLVGMTRLDLSTGRVTDQIDQMAANDSYFFLSSDRADEIRRREQEILIEVHSIARATSTEHLGSTSIIADLALYAEGKLTTPEIEARIKALPFSSDAFSYQELKRVAFETGRWDHILTPQEILLRTNGQVDERYLARPYTPLAVQDGEDVEGIAQLRQAERSMSINNALLGYERPFTFSLEGLSWAGDAIRSPAFVDEADGITVIDDKVRANFQDRITTFPFARPEDWFYQKPAE